MNTPEIIPGRSYSEEEIQEFVDIIVCREKKLVEIICQWRLVAAIFICWFAAIITISGIATMESNPGFSWFCFIFSGAAVISLIKFRQIFSKLDSNP